MKLYWRKNIDDVFVILVASDAVCPQITLSYLAFPTLKLTSRWLIYLMGLGNLRAENDKTSSPDNERPIISNRL